MASWRQDFLSIIPVICSGKAVTLSTKQCRKQVTKAKVFIGLRWKEKFTKLLTYLKINPWNGHLLLGLFPVQTKIKHSRMPLLCCWACCNRQWHISCPKCKAISYLGLQFMSQYLDRLEMFITCLARWHLKWYFINYDKADVLMTICLFVCFFFQALGRSGRKWKTDDLGQPSFLPIGNEKYM